MKSWIASDARRGWREDRRAAKRWQVLETGAPRGAPALAVRRGPCRAARWPRCWRELPFDVTWLDSRFDGFPRADSGGRAGMSPRRAWRSTVDEAPPARLFLVLTHSPSARPRHLRSHPAARRLRVPGPDRQRDQEGAVPERAQGDAAMAPAALERLVCPIGLAQIPGKQPMAIAVVDGGAVAGAAGGAGTARQNSEQSTGKPTRGRVTSVPRPLKLQHKQRGT